MTEKMTPYDAGRQDEDDVLEAFERARRAAPDDRTLLRAWAERFPGHADALIEVSYAGLAAGMSLSDPLEDGPTDAETVAFGRTFLDSYFATPPIASLVAEAGARGLAPAAFARALRLDTAVLGRLNQRLLEASTLPRALVRRMAEAIGRTADEVAAYLSQPPRLAAGAQYKAKVAPRLRESAPRQSFADIAQGLSQADRDFWQGETEREGLLGDE